MQRTAVILTLALAALHASAAPQAVTSAISPTASAPAGCSASYSTTFGIAVVSLTSAASSAASTKSVEEEDSATVVSQISDGQIQAATTAVPIQQISDGQIQHQTTTQAIQQISDGQIQDQTTATSQSQITATTEAVQQISDGQIQQQTSTTAEAATSTTQAVSQITDGQIQATATAAKKARDLVGCKSNTTLTMTLSDGKLVDDLGRTGYIASNYQFQFDKPPQAGAIYTSGWSACSNGSLALGGSAIFWQCLSGDFYNLYDRNFGAAQCSPVLLEVIGLEDCS